MKFENVTEISSEEATEKNNINNEKKMSWCWNFGAKLVMK